MLASENIELISLTFETSQLDKSQLKFEASKNIASMFVTLEVSKSFGSFTSFVAHLKA